MAGAVFGGMSAVVEVARAVTSAEMMMEGRLLLRRMRGKSEAYSLKLCPAKVLATAAQTCTFVAARMSSAECVGGESVCIVVLGEVAGGLG